MAKELMSPMQVSIERILGRKIHEDEFGSVETVFDFTPDQLDNILDVARFDYVSACCYVRFMLKQDINLSKAKVFCSTVRSLADIEKNRDFWLKEY